MQKKYYYWLDLLRFLSALLVVVAHCRANFFEVYAHLEPGSQTLFTKIFYFATSFSDDAVLLFFILSGFLVGGQTLERIISKENLSASEFAVSRIVRIGLPLFVSVIFIAVTDFALDVETSWEGILYNLFSLQNIWGEYAAMGGPLWTMPYIVWSYVLLYAFILLAKTSCRNKVLGIIVLCVVLVVFTESDDGKGAYKFLLILLGVLAYYLSKQSLPKVTLYFSANVVLLTAVLTKFAKPSISRDPSFVSELSVPLLQIVETVFLAVLVGQIVRRTPRSKISHWINAKSSKLAAFSYSLFLIHFQVIRLLAGMGFPRIVSINLNSMVLFLVEIFICIFCGYLFYWCVERHTNRIRSYVNRILN